MKKIITNTILKKFIWTTLLIMVVFQAFFPSFVFAKIEKNADGTYNCEDYTYQSDYYNEWLELGRELGMDKLRDGYETTSLQDYETAVINSIKELYCYDNYDQNTGQLIEDQAGMAQKIFRNRTAKGTLIVMASLSSGKDEILVDGVWDKEYLAEGIPWDAAYVRGGFLWFGENRDFEKHEETFREKYAYSGEWKEDKSFVESLEGEDEGTPNGPGSEDPEGDGSGNSSENTEDKELQTKTYSNFKEWLGTGYESDEVVYPIIEEKFKEYIKSLDQSMEMEEIIDDFAKFMFDKYKGDESVFKIQVEYVAPKEFDGNIENINVISVKIIDTVNGHAYNNGFNFQDDFNQYEESKGVASADGGGLLLDLLFPFVNFIADTILSFLGDIMIGEDGIKNQLVKPDATLAATLTKNDVQIVDMRPFITPLGLSHYVINYSPEEIFAGKVPLLSIDFISGKTTDGSTITDNGWNAIRQVIAQWYKVLRMIAIIGLLSVLIYTGIKIILSSNAKDKAKFKEWIINWFMAVAILFFMHYIMSFIISVTGQITLLISESSENIIIEKCEEVEDIYAPKTTKVNTENLFVTNLMGYCRFMVQSDNWISKIGYEVMYIALIVYTFKFTFIYLKRVLNMAFLTLIAPIVALTYPIDKMNDGSAQGFQMWLKEYVFNALLQPMHYIMYYILLSSAMGIAAKNPLYAIVCLMFMTEAEKLLKKIFGFDKAGAGTVGGMAGAFAAGALASNVKNIARMAGKLGGGNGGNGGDDKNPLDNPKPTEKNDFSEFDDPNSDQQQLDEGKDDQQQDNQGPDDEGEKTNAQKMVDAYDEEKFGTDEWDAQERDAMAREAYEPEGMNYSAEEYADILRDSGYEEDEIQNMVNEKYGTPQPETQPETQPEPQQPQQPQEDAGTPVREMAEQRDAQLEESRFKRGAKALGRGAKAVGKRLAKPIWDADKSAKYNFKRLARGGAKAIVGTAVGITAAAVQAGISITDGKYSIGEGLATFGAGFAGGSAMVNGLGGMVRTYQDGASAGDKQKQMERAQARYADRDDVIAFNKKEYPSDPKAAMERQRDNYLPNGVTDLKEMKSCMKYANTLTAGGMSQADADRRAAKVANFKKQLKDQGQAGAIYDQKKQQAYIDEMVKQAKPEEQAKLRGRYQNLFNAAQAFDKAQQ